MEYRKSMFPHGINGITIEYQLLMHRLSGRKHYILGFPIFSGRQSVEKRAWPIKKSPKSQKLKKIKVVEVGNIYLTGCQVANRYYKANYACITIVHHVTGEKISLFLTLRLFGTENGQVLRFWRPTINR